MFRFNYRGLWGNAGDFTLSNALGDLDAALDYLTDPAAAARFGHDPSTVLLIGYSFGTATALVGAAADDRVDGIVSLAACDHGYFGGEFADPDSEIRDFLDQVTEALFGEGGPIEGGGPAFIGDLVDHAEASRFVPLADELLDKKLLLLGGLDDAVCYVEDHLFPLYRRLRALDHPALDAQVLTMDHGFRGVGIDALMQTTADWIEASFPTPSETTMPDDLHDFATRYTAAWSSQDPVRVASFYAENGSLTINGGEPSVGREAIAESAWGLMTAFPNLVVAMDSLRVEGDAPEYHWTLTGTNTGPGGTGHAVRISGYEVWTMGDDGLIARSVGQFDEAEYQRQLEEGVEGSTP